MLLVVVSQQLYISKMFYILLINFLELLSSILGRNYVAKYRNDNGIRYFVYFLFFTCFVEVLGWLPRGIYYLESFSFLKDTFLKRNYWLYNIYFIISYTIYVFYFYSQVKSTKFRKILYFILIFYSISCVLNILLSKVYFNAYASYTFILGTLFVFISVAFYYFEILQSNRILTFHKSISFYISIGTLVFHLAVTPLLIYSKYFNSTKSPDFVQIHRIILTSANIFMYTCYSIGFIVCYRKNKSYS